MLKGLINRRQVLKLFTAILIICTIITPSSTTALAGTGYILNGQAKEWNLAIREISLRHGDVLQILSKTHFSVTFFFEDAWGNYTIKGASETRITNVHFVARPNVSNVTVDMEDIVASAPFYSNITPEGRASEPANFIHLRDGKNIIKTKGICKLIAGNSGLICGGKGIQADGDLIIEGDIDVVGGYGVAGGGAAIHTLNGSLSLNGNIIATGGDTRSGQAGCGLRATKDIKVDGTLIAKGGSTEGGAGGAGIYTTYGNIFLNGDAVVEGGKDKGINSSSVKTPSQGGFGITSVNGNIYLSGHIDSRGGDGARVGGTAIFAVNGDITANGNIKAVGGNGLTGEGGAALECEIINLEGGITARSGDALNLESYRNTGVTLYAKKGGVLKITKSSSLTSGDADEAHAPLSFHGDLLIKGDEELVIQRADVNTPAIAWYAPNRSGGAIYLQSKFGNVHEVPCLSLSEAPRLKIQAGKLDGQYVDAISTFDFIEQEYIPIDYNSIVGIDSFNVSVKSESGVVYELNIAPKP